jgi:uncharacterized 2Fe-2S/4Fe-4S cluster protein (DUF4445 family)
MANVYFPQFQQGKKGIKIHPGLTLLDFAQKAKATINAECAGAGTCGKCVVRIEKGEENLNPRTANEEKIKLEGKERLACQARVIKDSSDIIVYIENFGNYEILNYGMERGIPIKPSFYRKGERVNSGGRDIADYRGNIFGLAVDIGTTTIVFDLVDLENGNILDTIAETNPQISYGNDVISRIEYTMVNKEKGSYFEKEERAERVRTLQKILVETINDALEKISKNQGRNIASEINHAVIVGNSTMRDIFFGFDVASLGQKPYEPEEKGPVAKSPAELELMINPRGSVYGGALIGGHVGADINADILACEMYKNRDISLLIDIGTNGEVVLGNKDRMIAASCAAGGAFEGTTVSCGTGGIAGAVKKIEILDGRVVYSTIGNKSPLGVCGSGLIDLLAELLGHGIMSSKARLKEDFYITGGLKITQQDIFQLITSKAAIKTGWEILMKNYPVELKDVKKIYLSGGFGNFIDIKNAMKIGLIPQVEEERVEKIGNGSLEGAREMLLCEENRKLSEKISAEVEHIKTNEVEKEFDYVMATNMYFEEV